MAKLTYEEIQERFNTSKDFNEIFDAFEAAINSNIKNIELYRQLFWNDALSHDELCLFGEKLAEVFPDMKYDVYMWLGKVFEVTYSMYDNYESTIRYFRKAADVKPDEIETYIAVSDCYEPDLNLPPIDIILDFVKNGLLHVKDPTHLYLRLSELYEKTGNYEQSDYYRRKADESGGAHPEG